MQQWYNILSILGAIQGVLLAILLVTRKNNRQANRYLGAFVLLLTLSLTEQFYQPLLPSLAIELIGGFIFLYGPLIYLYIKILLGESITKTDYKKHFAPFYGYLIILFTLYIIDRVKREPAELILANLLFCQLLFYSFLALWRVHGESKKKDATHKLSVINWLKLITSLLAIIYTSAFIGMYLLIFGISASSYVLNGVQIGCVVVVYSLSYWSLMQADLTGQHKARVKYQHSALTDSDKEVLLEKILTFINLHQPFLQSTLTLDEFAKQFGVNRFYISQVINERTGKNFSDFVNTYRIEEAKRLLLDPKKAHFSIVGIAYEAGFNSKTAFNTTFKKLTGKSPSEYRKSFQKDVRIEQSG